MRHCGIIVERNPLTGACHIKQWQMTPACFHIIKIFIVSVTLKTNSYKHIKFFKKYTVKAISILTKIRKNKLIY